MQKRFCDLQIGDKIYEIAGDHMFIDTITGVSILECCYDFYLQDQTLLSFSVIIPPDYINESTYFNKNTEILYTTDIKVFLHGL